MLDGQKRWIGNGTIADVVVVWARDDDGQVGAFVVEHPDGAEHPVPGYHAKKIVGKAANRGVWQAEIRLDGVRVPAGARLRKARTWDDTNYVLAKSRQTVAWEALGHAVAAYEAALTYSLRREQFGRPLARFQLIQGQARAHAQRHHRHAIDVHPDVAVAGPKGGCRSRPRWPSRHRLRSSPGLAVTRLGIIPGGNGILLDHRV